jgi:hypothetical protein
VLYGSLKNISIALIQVIFLGFFSVSREMAGGTVGAKIADVEGRTLKYSIA